jgi:hypothetical protein
MTDAVSAWERILERGSLNEIRCSLLELARQAPQADELHYRLMEALEAACERGEAVGVARGGHDAEHSVRIASVSPTDSRRVMVLGSLLFASSKGWLPNACEALLPVVRGLMPIVREDHCADGAEGVVERLLAIADRRFAIEELARCALAELRAF